jgi:hypothetical protein
MQRPFGLNVGELYDNSYQMNMNVLSAEERGSSRIVRERRQIVRFSEPEKQFCTTLVEGVEQPVTSSGHSIIEPTLVTENEQERSENGRARSHDGKNTKQRGRPKLNIIDSTLAEVNNFSITVAECGADIDY